MGVAVVELVGAGEPGAVGVVSSSKVRGGGQGLRAGWLNLGLWGWVSSSKVGKGGLKGRV